METNSKRIKKDAKQRMARDMQEIHGVIEVVNVTYIIHPIWPRSSFLLRREQREQCWTLQEPGSDTDLQGLTAMPKCDVWEWVLDWSLLHSPRSGTAFLESVKLLQNCTSASRDKNLLRIYVILEKDLVKEAKQKQRKNVSILLHTLWSVVSSTRE